MSQATLFHYRIAGLPVDRKYQVLEAMWHTDTQQLSPSETYVLSSHQIRKWLGYNPSIYGTERTMWLYVPGTIKASALQLWLADSTCFQPYVIETLRFFPSDGMPVAEQARERPARFQGVQSSTHFS